LLAAVAEVTPVVVAVLAVTGTRTALKHQVVAEQPKHRLRLFPEPRTR
jgi:hypothetical protein